MHSGMPSNAWESTAIYAGPALSYAGKSWWASLTVMPQLAGFQPAGMGLDLDHHERWNIRTIFGWHL